MLRLKRLSATLLLELRSNIQTHYMAGRRSRRLAALTSSLALKAQCAFNFEQAQRSELPFHATL